MKLLSTKTAEIFKKEINYTYPIDYVWIDGKIFSKDLFSDIPECSLDLPNLSEVLDFLRDRKGIHINAIPLSKDRWYGETIDIKENGISVKSGIESKIYPTYQEAVEDQIRKVYEED